MTKLKNLKCPNWIKPRFTAKKGLRKADKRAAIYRYDYLTRFAGRGWNTHLPDTHVQCGGNLSVTLDARLEPCMGGCDAVLELTIKCDTCGTAYLMQPDTCVTDWAEQLIADALNTKEELYAGVQQDSNGVQTRHRAET
jgi:hypothetical protein